MVCSGSWQTLIKIETLLAAPILVFCLFNAQNIAPALYGASYDPVGPLLAIFLFFNILVRALGTTMHQYTLYVIGKPSKVVLGQWIGLLALVLIGIALIPRWGPAGALTACRLRLHLPAISHRAAAGHPPAQRQRYGCDRQCTARHGSIFTSVCAG